MKFAMYLYDSLLSLLDFPLRIWNFIQRKNGFKKVFSTDSTISDSESTDSGSEQNRSAEEVFFSKTGIDKSYGHPISICEPRIKEVVWRLVRNQRGRNWSWLWRSTHCSGEKL